MRSQTLIRAPLRAAGLLAFLALAGCAVQAPPQPQGLPQAAADKLQRVGHVVVIYAENHSFDNMYGLFPGANGIANATPAQYTQLDHDGTPLPELVVFGANGKPDPAFPRMPNKPFRIDAPPVNRPPTTLVPSPIHAFFHNQEQINGGRNNMFAALSTVGGWVMGHYDGSQFRLWHWAQEYTLADNFFMGAFGGSYLNHQYLICACAPRHENAPAAMVARLDANGKLEKKPGSPSAREGAVQVWSSGGGQVTPDGFSVNTSQPPYQPSGVPPAPGGPLALADPAGSKAAGVPVPPQTARTVGDTLSARGIDWAWYAGGYRAALADGMQPPGVKRSVIYVRAPGSPNFQPHHQPFNYYARFAPGTADRERHLKDGEDFLQAIERGTLPPVAFYKPAGVNTQHPSYTDIATGDEHVAGVLEKLRASPQWKDMLVIVTYDENGGYWDHVAPPAGPGWGDRFGPGTRIPTLLVGPMVKRGFIDHTAYDTTSILKFITERFGLEPLPGVRRNMGDLTGALQ
ncbi:MULTISPECIES: acid phosphatase [Ramlibacter]|uniref:Acid phosphatase n=1 Tax=Ramlibacter aquaticus TaxID=2780094 RepID=A0ABR9SJ58_9BURK|nr:MULTISPECIES: acid phosphatase [Ramlibacter]MBE7942372.1 acid phosphatase [Ramlibacter aquaticus]